MHPCHGRIASAKPVGPSSFTTIWGLLKPPGTKIDDRTASPGRPIDVRLRRVPTEAASLSGDAGRRPAGIGEGDHLDAVAAVRSERRRAWRSEHAVASRWTRIIQN